MPKLRQSSTQKADDELRGYIGQCLARDHMKACDLAVRLGMCKASIYNKMRNPSRFTVGELRRLFTVLRLADDEKLKVV